MVAVAGNNANGGTQSTGNGRVWPAWHGELAAFRHADTRMALWQLGNTLLPYLVLWYLMVRALRLGYPFLVIAALAVLAAAFLVRLFILFHDCVHGAFFPARWANNLTGYLCGMLVFTSFEDWRFSHLRHHVSYANLDARGYGDIWTMTLREYEAASRWQRWLYRLYRNPLVLFGLGALFTFNLGNRLPTRKVRRAERMSVLFTNLLIVAVAILAAHFIGWRLYLALQLTVLWLAGVAGIWLFYVQHQFAGVYWARKGVWDPLRAALQGSSFYDLPALLRWVSGNIGYHHVHHLGPRIPNYRLKACFEAIPALQARSPLTVQQSLGCVRLKVWDEDRQELVGFP